MAGKTPEFVIPAERLKRISDYIEQRGNAKISDLAQELGVSESTVRRDLDTLVREGLIQRSHGGATWIRHSSSYEHVYSEKMLIRGDEKKRIGAFCAEMVRDGDTLFLDSGTTTFQLAKLFPNARNYVITTCLNCAIELSSREDVSILMLGGSINKNSYCVNGSIAAEMVENMRFNIAFLGVSGYFPGTGFATSVAEDYVLRQKIVERSDCTVILMDSSKASSRGIYTFAPLDTVSYVVSDGHLPQEMVEEVTASGITVL